MRTIKFRVWDEQNKEMFEWDDVSDTPLLNDAFYGRDAVAMQFTGLKDKNGREIYEGDICIGWRYGGNKEGIKHPFTVIWRELAAADDSDLTSYGFHFNDYYNEFEVIGNIYENPNLCKN